MATTIKASSAKAKPSGATNPIRCVGGWTRCATGVVFQGGDCGSDASANNTICGGSSAGTGKTRAGVWIYGPLNAQTISGCVTTTIRGNDVTFTNLYHPRTAIYIMKPCGTLRATVLAQTGPACLFSTVATDYTFTNALTSQSALAGDYLVTEAGYGAGCFLCTDTGKIIDGSTGPHTRWVFTGTFTLQTVTNTNQLMMMGMGT